jgi:hypothetical protein
MPFPLESLPPWLRQMVIAVARSAQTDEAMPAAWALGFAASTVARRVVVAGIGGRRDPLNLWPIVIAESGEGKSSTFAPLIAPLERVQTVLLGGADDGDGEREAPDPGVQPARTRFERADLFDDADPAQPSPSVAGPRWATLALAVEAAAVGMAPGVEARFIARDATPEGLNLQMDGLTMGLLQASPEGGFASWLAVSGAHAVGQLANLNLAWEGATIITSRASRGSLTIPRAVLTLVAGPQPAAWSEIVGGNRGRLLRETGFLARALYCIPESWIGRRQARAPSVPADVTRSYEQHVWAMLIAGRAGVPRPREIVMSDRALHTYEAYYDRFEPRLGGDLRPVAPWATRVRQSVLRIAGILHVAENVGQDRDRLFELPLSEATMHRAITIGEWAIPHGVRALASARGGPRAELTPGESLVETVRAVLARPRFSGSWFTVRDVHRAEQRDLRARDVDYAIEHLVDRGEIERDQGSRTVRYRVVPTAGNPDPPGDR